MWKRRRQSELLLRWIEHPPPPPSTHTGSFEISCRLPQAEWLPSAAAAAAQGPGWARGALRVCSTGARPASGQESGRQSRPALAAASPAAASGSRAAGRWRHLRPRDPIGAVPARRPGPEPREPSAGKALGPSSPRVRPERQARPRQLRSPPGALLGARRSPKKPCTIPSGWLSQSSPQGMALRAGASAARAGGASPWAERARSEPGCSPGGSSAPSSHARGASRAAGLQARRPRGRAPPGCGPAAGAARWVPASTSHNGGKPRPPTALPATWVELEREGRRARAAQSRRGGRGRGAAAILEAGRDPAAARPPSWRWAEARDWALSRCASVVEVTVGARAWEDSVRLPHWLKVCVLAQGPRGTGSPRPWSQL